MRVAPARLLREAPASREKLRLLGLTAKQVSDRIRERVRVTLEVALASVDEIRKRTVIEGRRKPVLVFDRRTERKEERICHETA